MHALSLLKFYVQNQIPFKFLTQKNPVLFGSVIFLHVRHWKTCTNTKMNDQQFYEIRLEFRSHVLMEFNASSLIYSSAKN